MMNKQTWSAWCGSVVNSLTRIQTLGANQTVTLNNLEKSLASYHRMQKRMLYVMCIGFVAVIGNGLLLFYK